MKFRRPPPPRSALDDAIESAIFELAGYDATSKEHSTAVKQLEKLYKLRSHDRPERVSNETLTLVGANLAGILIIVCHERVHIIATKALPYIRKLL